MKRQFVHFTELFQNPVCFGKKVVITLRQSHRSLLRLFVKQILKHDAGLFKNEFFSLLRSRTVEQSVARNSN